MELCACTEFPGLGAFGIGGAGFTRDAGGSGTRDLG